MAIVKQDFEQFMNQARVTLVGASEAGLRGAFYDTLAEFFNDSSSWTQDVVVSAVPGRRHYPLVVNEGQIIRLGGVFTAPPPTGSGVNTLPGGLFIPALMPEIGELVINHSPSSATQYIASVVCNVSLPTAKDAVPIAPAWVLPVWHVGILDGLLGKMMMQPNKSYSNVQTSAYHLKRFRDAIARARVSKLRANTNGSQAWRFPQQFRANTQQGGVPSVGSTNERIF